MPMIRPFVPWAITHETEETQENNEPRSTSNPRNGNDGARQSGERRMTMKSAQITHFLCPRLFQFENFRPTGRCHFFYIWGFGNQWPPTQGIIHQYRKSVVSGKSVKVSVKH